MRESGAQDAGAGMLAAPPVHPNVETALAALLGHTPGVWAQTEAPAGGRTIDTFAVLPSSRDPRLLVPPSRRAAASALRQYTNATSRGLWVRAEAMAWALRLGAGRRIARGRLHVLADHGYDGGLPLGHLLQEVFGAGPLELAVRLGPIRPNRKPVIQVLRPDGKVLGYTKVSRTELTARLVANEATMLARVAEAAPRTFRVPEVLHSGEWAGMQVLVVGPLPRHAPALRGADARIPVAATKELAELFGTTREPLAGSPHWKATRARIAAVTGPAAAALASAADQIEQRHGGAELAVGTWHGDWTPSNMAGRNSGLSVWDWERSCSGMPVGMDAGHFGFHIARKLRRLAPKPAAGAALAWLPEVLEGVGIDRRHAGLMLSLALLEMAVRFQEARAEGVEVTDPAYLGALEDLLAKG